MSDMAPQRQIPVGRTHQLFYDNSRSNWLNNNARPLAATIWYPADATAKEQAWNISIFKAGWSAKDANISEQQEKYPLVILSHGTGGSAMQLSWLAETLASHGYIVAAVNHHGNTAAEDNLLPQGFMLWWERSQDMSVLIDKLLLNEQFGKRIDETKIAMAGFSLGGYTSLSVAGAITDRIQWQNFCKQTPDATICKPPPESNFNLTDFENLILTNKQVKNSILHAQKSYLDKRIKAIYVIAPVHAPAFTESSLADIKVPVKLVVGTADSQAQPHYNAKLLASLIPDAKLWLLKDVSHYTFLANCTLKGKVLVAELCGEKNGINRTSIHHQVSQDALSYFNEIL